MTTGVPSGTRASTAAAASGTRTQPWETACPILDGSFVPWMPTCPSPPPNSDNVGECADNPSANAPYAPVGFPGRTRSVTKNVPVGVGSVADPIPTFVEATWTPSSTTVIRRVVRSTAIRSRLTSTFTAEAGTHPVDPFGRTGTCTCSHPGFDPVTSNTRGDPSEVTAGSRTSTAADADAARRTTTALRATARRDIASAGASDPATTVAVAVTAATGAPEPAPPGVPAPAADGGSPPHAVSATSTTDPTPTTRDSAPTR